MITDFGFAKNFYHSTPKTCLGTAAYVAPEVLQLQPYDGTKVDAWACGVILFAMLDGDYPFGVGNGKGVGRMGDRELYKRVRLGWEGVDFPRHFAKGATRLIKRLLEADPDHRCSCEEVRSMVFAEPASDVWSAAVLWWPSMVGLGCRSHFFFSIPPRFSESSSRRSLLSAGTGRRVVQGGRDGVGRGLQ